MDFELPVLIRHTSVQDSFFLTKRDAMITRDGKFLFVLVLQIPRMYLKKLMVLESNKLLGAPTSGIIMHIGSLTWYPAVAAHAA